MINLQLYYSDWSDDSKDKNMDSDALQALERAQVSFSA